MRHGNTAGPDSSSLTHSALISVITHLQETTHSEHAEFCLFCNLYRLRVERKYAIRRQLYASCTASHLLLHRAWRRNQHPFPTIQQRTSWDIFFKSSPKQSLCLHIIATLFYNLFVFISSICLLRDRVSVQYWQMGVWEEQTSLLVDRQKSMKQRLLYSK